MQAEYPSRKSNRLPGFDYSTPGTYFITVCAYERRCRFSRIVGDGKPVPLPSGRIAENYVRLIPARYPCARVEHFVVMPNHIHLLLSLHASGGTGNPSPTIGSIIGWYKYNVTKQVHRLDGDMGTPVFQRSYYDHVVRDIFDFQRIWNYIEGNPGRWKEDALYSETT